MENTLHKQYRKDEGATTNERCMKSHMENTITLQIFGTRKSQASYEHKFVERLTTIDSILLYHTPPGSSYLCLQGRIGSLDMPPK